MSFITLSSSSSRILRNPSTWSLLQSRARHLLTLFIACIFLITLFGADDAEARKKRRKRTPPALQILAINFSNNPYTAGNGVLDMELEVRLPPHIDPSSIIEVSFLLSSPSKRHFRFLSVRKPIDLLENQEAALHSHFLTGSTASPTPVALKKPSRRMFVVLSWDGTDQYKKLVTGGTYDYVARVKLLEITDTGVRTKMVSWKKKGNLQIKTAQD